MGRSVNVVAVWALHRPGAQTALRWPDLLVRTQVGLQAQLQLAPALVQGRVQQAAPAEPPRAAPTPEPSRRPARSGTARRHRSRRPAPGRAAVPHRVGPDAPATPRRRARLAGPAGHAASRLSSGPQKRGRRRALGCSAVPLARCAALGPLPAPRSRQWAARRAWPRARRRMRTGTAPPPARRRAAPDHSAPVCAVARRSSACLVENTRHQRHPDGQIGQKRLVVQHPLGGAVGGGRIRGQQGKTHKSQQRKRRCPPQVTG